MRNLTGYKQVVAYALSVLILSGRWQPCGAFGFVHGSDGCVDVTDDLRAEGTQPRDVTSRPC